MTTRTSLHPVRSDSPSSSWHLDLHQHRVNNNNSAASASLSAAALTTSNDYDQRKPRQARKPSPGLAARLKALGFGKDSNEPTLHRSPSNDRIGRIPEDQIQKLDLIHRANSVNSAKSPNLQARGRAWSGTSGLLTPQVTGGSYTEIPPVDLRVLEGGKRRPSSAASSKEREVTTLAGSIDMDSQKYRLPEHTNGNGTKAMSDTKQAHIERDIPPDDETPPPPIAKDTPPGGTTPAEFTGDASSFFNPFGLQRTGSIYTLSRVSFANQLAQLTSLQLPDAELLSTKVSAIPTSKAASKALMGAAEQIRSWISKASEVVSGLDGEDDVEWAAAGGREGLEEVDNAISRFTELINVYVSAIESLQNRPDISTVSPDELKKVVLQVETILLEWEKIRRTLKGVKNSVEIAMEWEELWNIVLGDIGNEMDVLARLVFEMEEKRHKSLMAETGADGGLDLNELSQIVEDTPPSKAKINANNRFSVTGSFPLTPTSPNPSAVTAQDDSSLLALFARMQPLRASLDFLPMRLSTFHYRAEKIFPTACEELETRRTGLESSWKNLEKDAESLRRELGEDRWVLVFRGAGRQAQKMYESVDRSVVKLKEAVESGTHLHNPASIGKKIESYEAKKMHYGPAIERVLSIIERGVKDRLTVNGEILRLHSEMQRKWEGLKEQMSELDMSLEELQADKKNQQLRDSISSMLSNDRSTIGSHYDTPGSSPASSVVLTGLAGQDMTPVKNGKVRPGSTLPQPGVRRNSSNLTTQSQLPRKGLTNRLSTMATPIDRATPSPNSSRQGSATPTGNRLPRPSLTHNPDGRPRWNSSVNVKDTIIGHNFKPLSLTTPSPHARSKPPSAHANRSNVSVDSKIPLRSPLSRDNTSSPAPETTPSRKSMSRTGFRDRLISPGPYSQQVLSQNSLPARPRLLTSKTSMSNLSNTANRRASMQPKSSDPTSFSSPPSKPTRPASSLAANRRVSLLPQPKGKNNSAVTGRESPQAIAGAASAMRTSSINSQDSKGKEKKPWK